MHRPLISIAIFFSMVLFLCVPGSGASNEDRPMIVSEYKLKAAYLYNFSKFIRWPKSSFANDNSAFVIGILGDDTPMAIAALLKSRKIGTHPIEVRRYKTEENIRKCHLLYLQNKQKKVWMPIIRRLKDSTVITVGDAKGFADNGGIIQLVTMRNRLRFIINLKAASAAGVDLDSRLLSLALELKE